MSKKLTKKDYFNKLLTFAEVQADEGVTAFIKHELELLGKKNASDRKLTPQQKENAEIARRTVDLMKAEPARLFSITELMKNISGLPEDFKSQRMTAILRTLLPTVGTGEVLRVEDKRKVFFKYNPDYTPADMAEDIPSE